MRSCLKLAEKSEDCRKEVVATAGGIMQKCRNAERFVTWWTVGDLVLAAKGSVGSLLFP
jgi:hypothetical protein